MPAKNKGATLIEVVVVTVLASMIFGSAMGIWSYARRNMSRTATRQTLQQDATRILTHLSADLKAAKGETFSSTEDPMALEFTRYCVNPEDNSKLSSEMTQKVKYVFKKPVLRRYVDGKLANSLSYSVENIQVKRKEISEEARKSDPYLEARVDIMLEMGQRAPGTSSDEHFIKHTSAVIRDEFYALANKERSDVFDEADKAAEEMVKENDSSFFSDTLDADSLKSLTDEQLNDLEKTQEVNLADAKKGLDEIEKQIKKVDSGDGFFNMWWWKSEEAEQVEELKQELMDIECPDSGIPTKDSGNRASQKAEKIVTKLEDQIKTMEKRFMEKAFTGSYASPDSTDPAVKEKADLQKRAYDMKVMDRQVENALKEMSDEEKAEAEANGSIPRKMIDQYSRSDEEIRREIVSSGVAPEGSTELEEMVQKEIAKVNALKAEYNSCNVEFLDDGSENERTIQAYDAAKQLKSLAQSKSDTFELKELAIDNLAEIEEARKLKKEQLQDTNN
ncbi:MAG: hypothetical protein AB1403_04520 [Candidatus Riflebacteria bacterium]